MGLVANIYAKLFALKTHSHAGYSLSGHKHTKSDITDLGDVSGGTSYVVETGSNDNGYYRKYPDGYIEQWGTRTGISQTIDLPKSFASTNYSVQFTHIDANGHQGAPIFEIISKSESSFTMKAWTTGSTINNITSTDGQVDWKACGY